jgi:hypothetical protein
MDDRLAYRFAVVHADVEVLLSIGRPSPILDSAPKKGGVRSAPFPVSRSLFCESEPSPNYHACWSGQVQQVLEEWTLPPISLWAVYPSGRLASTKARVFVNWFEELMHVRPVSTTDRD